jgi:NitT/TauT family transport system permease protein
MMIRQAINPRIKLILGILSIVVLLSAYSFMSYKMHLQNPDDTTIPGWTQLYDGFQKSLEVNKRSGERWLVVDTEATMSRLLQGLLLGIIVSIFLGLLMGCYTTMEAIFVPPLSLLAKIPPTAALAVFFVLVGTGHEMYVAMIAFGILPTLSQSVYLAVKEVPDELLFKAYTLGASQMEIIFNIIFPTILPKIIDSIRLQVGPAMVYLIAAEMVCGDVGYGYRIRLQSRLLNMNVVYPYLAVLAMIGYFMDASLNGIRRFFCPWNEKNQG